MRFKVRVQRLDGEVIWSLSLPWSPVTVRGAVGVSAEGGSDFLMCFFGREQRWLNSWERPGGGARGCGAGWRGVVLVIAGVAGKSREGKAGGKDNSGCTVPVHSHTILPFAFPLQVVRSL